MRKVPKQEADAYDRILDAAADLASLIEESRIEVDEYALEELTIFLAGHAGEVREILKDAANKWRTAVSSGGK